MQLLTNFANRDELIDYLREHFSGAAARDSQISPTKGGRAAAEQVLGRVRVDRYAATRNTLTGAVTRLSPYLRHGVLTLAEVRRHVLQQATPQKAYKLLQELAWRDYYQRVYHRLGNDIWRDIEPARTGIRNYAQDLPADITEGTTGAVCIDSFAHDLHATGYLHNHARMWIAAYVVHHRRIRWQAGARWFLQHLLDGDPASNNLSWQWVASTFASKPYFFNRENLARYTENVYCERCPLARGRCPFEGSYEDVAERIFPGNAAQVTQEGPGQSDLMRRLSMRNDDNDKDLQPDSVQADAFLVWINEENLSPHNPALTAHPQSTPIFIFDEQAIEAAGWTLKRIAFIYESLLEIPALRIYRGSPAAIIPGLIAAQRDYGYKNVTLATTPAVEPRLRQQQQMLAKFAPLVLYPVEPFAPIERVRDLRRFSRYWNDVEQMVVWEHKKA